MIIALFLTMVCSIVLDTTIPEVILISITPLVGIFAVSAALEGYIIQHMPVYQRIMCLIGGLMLIYPGLLTDMIGLGLFAAVVAMQVVTRKKAVGK